MINKLFYVTRIQMHFHPMRNVLPIGLLLSLTCPWFRTSIIHNNYFKRHECSYRELENILSAVTCRDVILRQWWLPLELQPQISGRKDLCLELLQPNKPLLPASRSTWKITWGANEEHWGRLFLKISQYFPWICVPRSSEKQPLIWGWFSARDDSLVIFQQRETLLRQKNTKKIHKNEIYRASVCPHHPGVEETIHSIWGKRWIKATLSYFTSDSFPSAHWTCRKQVTCHYNVIFKRKTKDLCD